MPTYKDRVHFTTPTTGTGAITVGTAVTRYRTPAAASLANGASVRLIIEDGNAWEISNGVYNSAGPSFTRSLIASSTGALLNLSGSAVALIDIISDDLPSGSIVGTSDTQTLTNKTLTAPSLTDHLRFAASQVPSAGVNDLDDYEEGTFTPGFTFSGGATGVTYSLQQGYYQKSGNKVAFSARVTLSSKGSSTGTPRITGLPFTVKNVANSNPKIGVTVDSGSSLGSPVAEAMANTTQVLIYSQTSTGAVTLVDTNINNTTGFVVTGFYFTD